jgi:propanol-preferring alcohol dehydrogenase
MTMCAMVLEAPGQPLCERELTMRAAGPGQVLVRVHACAVCRTDLHVIDGELPGPKLPLIPGHETIGEIIQLGPGVKTLALGQRVGIPWLGWTCGECKFCRSGRENLCDRAEFNGYTRDGGYAEFTVAEAEFCFPLSQTYSAAEAAPLLCAGLIGYRSLRLAGGPEQVKRLGLYGFGAAAHLILQVARWQGREVFAFTRPGDEHAQEFSRAMGAVWAGGSAERPPGPPLDAAILFAPVGDLVPAALRAVDKGGRVVCGGIHMSDIPAFPYRLLWEERSVCSVANLTRADAQEFLALAPEVPVRARTQVFPMRNANDAITALRTGRVEGAAVLVPDWRQLSVAVKS